MPRISECYLMKQLKQNTLVVRAKTSMEGLSKVIGESYGAIFQYMAEIGERCAAVPFIIYHNMDMQNMDVEIGVVVSKKCEEKGDVKAGVIEECFAATTVHLGSYKELCSTYSDLEKWIKDSKCVEDSKLKPNGVCIEWYHNDWTTIAEEKLVTTVSMFLK